VQLLSNVFVAKAAVTCSSNSSSKSGVAATLLSRVCESVHGLGITGRADSVTSAPVHIPAVIGLLTDIAGFSSAADAAYLPSTASDPNEEEAAAPGTPPLSEGEADNDAADDIFTDSVSNSVSVLSVLGKADQSTAAAEAAGVADGHPGIDVVFGNDTIALTPCQTQPGSLTKPSSSSSSSLVQSVLLEACEPVVAAANVAQELQLQLRLSNAAAGADNGMCRLVAFQDGSVLLDQHVQLQATIRWVFEVLCFAAKFFSSARARRRQWCSLAVAAAAATVACAAA
jgi:hypothetical protein